MYNDELLDFINENTDFKIKKEDSFILAEAFYIDDDKHPAEKRKLMVRSISVDKINHVGLRTVKLKSKSTSNSSNPHTRKEGLPITFTKTGDGENSSWDWDIAFKTEKEKKNALSELDKNDIIFLNKVISKGGEDFAEYWDLNINRDKDRIKEIEDKYKKKDN